MVSAVNSSYEVYQCTEFDADNWNTFVKNNPLSNYCHLFEWKSIIENSYKLITIYLVLRDKGDWVAVLPIALMPGIGQSGIKAVSLGYCNYGGVLVSPNIRSNAALDHFVAYLHFHGIHRVEIRGFSGSEKGSSNVTMIKKLSAPPQDVWMGLDGDSRRKVRRALKHGLSVTWGRHQVSEFYNIYSDNMGRLGTPVHSDIFFREMLDNLGEYSNIITIMLGDKYIGAILTINYGSVWATPYIASLSAYNSLYTNMLMYWEVIRAACEAGATEIDFGRCYVGSGTYNFKKKWGAIPHELYYRTYINKKLFNKSTIDSYRSLIGACVTWVWKIIPRSIQSKYGPIIRRRLP